MANIALESGVASEFIQYLTRQLDEAREQLQRSNEDNVALRAQLGDPLSGGSPVSHSVLASSTEVKQELKSLRKELKRVRKELDDTQESATRYEAEAASWRTRYQQLEPILAIPEIVEGQELEKMRQELAGCATLRDESSTGQTLKQFRAVLRSFPDIPNSVNPGASRPVFGGTSPPQLSKTARNVCTGDICFFGDFLRWSNPLFQHAYAVFPAHQYKWKAPKDEPAWAAVDDLASFVGQQRELLYVDDGKICYAGTFLCHSGPKPVKVAKLAKLGDDVDESFVNALARKTLHVTTNNSQTRQSTGKMNSLVPIIADLYNEGTARVRILGLQRIGFNKELFQILRSVYEQRAQKAAAGGSAPAKDVEPPGKARTHAAQPKGKNGNKRPRGGRKGGRARPGKSRGAEECAPRPAKIRRLA